MKTKGKSFRTLDLTMISWIHAKGTDKEEKILKKQQKHTSSQLKTFVYQRSGSKSLCNDPEI